MRTTPGKRPKNAQLEGGRKLIHYVIFKKKKKKSKWSEMRIIYSLPGKKHHSSGSSQSIKSVIADLR